METYNEIPDSFFGEWFDLVKKMPDVKKAVKCCPKLEDLNLPTQAMIDMSAEP